MTQGTPFVPAFLVTSTPGTLVSILTHLTVTKAAHRNIHLRETTVLQKKRSLRYLHAIVLQTNQKILGMASGPTMFVEYEIDFVNAVPQLNVLAYNWSGSTKDLVHFGKRFDATIAKRIKQELVTRAGPVRRTPGEYYLRRAPAGTPGSSVNAPQCIAAVGSKAVDQRLIGVLAPWRLQLVQG
jgi:hypothetical protein